MDAKIFLIFIIHALAVLSIATVDKETNNDAKSDLNNINDASTADLRSRSKRFVVFPDGSSFQFVIYTQNQGYLQVGDIVWFGNTAALAWKLPTDPFILDIFKDHKKGYENHRRNDVSKHIYYLDEGGKVISKVPYRKRPIVSPVFAKRSVDGTEEEFKTLNFTIKEMHEKQRNINYFDNLHENSIQLHREGRKSLYIKLEKFFQGLGWNGRECVLRTLCETGKGGSNQGTFLREIVKATFTLPKGREFDSEVHKQYDVAHGTRENCAMLYPECEDIHGL